MKFNSVVKVILLVIVSNLVVSYVGMSTAKPFESIPISWAFGANGLISFFGIYIISLMLEGKDNSENSKMKNAIAGSLLIMYLHLISVYIFDDIVTAETEETKYIISNFTNLVSVVVVSYFGASAIEFYTKSRKEDK